MGQRGKTWLMTSILCALLLLTPILVGAQDDDAEATPEATAESVVTDEEITAEATEEAVVTDEEDPEADEEEVSEEAPAETVTDADAPRTLFEVYAVEDEDDETEEEPGGIGLLFFIAGLGAVGAVGMAMLSRDRGNITE